VQDAINRSYKPDLRLNDGCAVYPEFSGQGVDAMLRNFKKSVNRAGVLKDFKRHECFLPKGERPRLKSAAARRRRAKAGLGEQM
jgi:ribosomal protein S21